MKVKGITYTKKIEMDGDGIKEVAAESRSTELAAPSLAAHELPANTAGEQRAANIGEADTRPRRMSTRSSREMSFHGASSTINQTQNRTSRASSAGRNTYDDPRLVQNPWVANQS